MSDMPIDSKKYVVRLFIGKCKGLEKPGCRNQLQSLGSGELCNGTDISGPSGEISDEQRKAKERRKLETMQRFHAFLKMNDGYTVFRPLLRYNGTDIEYEVEKNHIPTLATPCRFGDQRPKRVLENYYRQLGTSFDYNRLLEYARQALSFPDASTWTAMTRKEYLGKYF